jgi:hypothetical protein
MDDMDTRIKRHKRDFYISIEEMQFWEETYLRLLERIAEEITTWSIKNYAKNNTDEIQQTEEVLLKQELMMHDSFSTKSHISAEKAPRFVCSAFSNMITSTMYILSFLVTCKLNETNQARLERATHQIVFSYERFQKINSDCESILCSALKKLYWYLLVPFLLKFGPDVTSADKNGNTPLHFLTSRIGKYDMMLALDENQGPDVLENLILLHLKLGAHADARNQRGEIPSVVLSRSLPGFDALQYETLQCLAARALRQRESWSDGLPALLIDFVAMH